MGQLKKDDLLKRNNLNIFIEKIMNGDSFTELTKTGPIIVCNGEIILTLNNNTLYKKVTKQNKDEILNIARTICNTPGPSSKIEIKNKNLNVFPTTKLFKSKEFGGQESPDGESSLTGKERQEHGLIKHITENVAKQQIFIKEISVSEYIISAHKKSGLSSIKKEPLTDIYIKTNKKEYGVSCKGQTAPSLAGGGLLGLELTAKGAIEEAFLLLKKKLESMGLKEGQEFDFDDVPDFHYMIPLKYIEPILTGVPEMGGPVHFMYIGPMDVTSSHSGKFLIFNNGSGNLYTIKKYKQKVQTFFIRFRKRDIQGLKSGKISFSQNPRGKTKYPIIFEKLKVPGSSHLRIVVDDRPSKDSIPLN